MNCPFCNATVADNVAFCTNCGNSLGNVESMLRNQKASENDSQRYHSQRSSVRKSETDLLNSIIAHFSKKQHIYDEYERVAENLRYYEKGSSSALIVWGAILVTFGLLYFVSGAALFLFLLLIPGALMFLGGILIKVNNACKCNRYEREYKKLSLELCNYYITYPNCPIPAEYTNPRILYVVMNTIQYGRADSIREAVNYVLCSIDQKNFGRYMNDMQRYTGRINYETGVSVIFAASHLFA